MKAYAAILFATTSNGLLWISQAKHHLRKKPSGVGTDTSAAGIGLVGLGSDIGTRSMLATTIPQFDFSSIPPAENITESVSTFDARQSLVVQWFAEGSLPGCDDADHNSSTNCHLDCKTDAKEFGDWTVANILMGNSVNASEQILMNDTTIPFAIPGTGVNWNNPDAFCYRKGDYDFALIDFLHIAYISRANPGILSQEAYDKLVTEMLTVYGNDHNRRYRLNCGPRKDIVLSFQDTENHILRKQVAQYLTNQLLAEYPENANNTLFDNELNGNNAWMLDYLAKFFEDWFYEYNSRPYQGYNLLSLTLLYDYAEDDNVKLAAQMLLDLLSGWSGLQTNKLRRFMPFRRQPKYIEPSDIESSQGYYSWAGDGEAERLAMTAGNYGYLKDTNWTLPDGDGLRHFILYAATTSYRMNDVLLDLAIGGDDDEPQFFASVHDGAVEMYYNAPKFLLSAGGVYRDGEPFALSDFDNVALDVVEYVINIFNQEEGGWAQPTTVVPTQESSADIRDMIQFQGHQDLEKRGNTCIGPPGFACGLAPDLGNKVSATGDSCLTKVEGHDNWQFFDFRNSSGCELDYDLLFAIYSTDCDTERCSNASATDTYGLLEVVDASTAAVSSIDDFASQVLSNNPGQFASEGVETYRTIGGVTIEFEIFPEFRERPSLHSVNGTQYARSTENWPMARGDIVQSTTSGRWTFDSPRLQKRLILDMTKPQMPQRLYADLPTLSKSEEIGSSNDGTFFDDGYSVVNSRVAYVGIVFSDRFQLLNGIYMGWENGLESIHGDTTAEVADSLTLVKGEYIREMQIGGGMLTDGPISHVRIRTSLGREIRAGYPISEQSATFTAPDGQQIAALHGHSLSEMIMGLGVVYSDIF